MQLTLAHNLTPPDAVPVLAGAATALDVVEELRKALAPTHTREPIRERSLREIVARFQVDGARLDQHLLTNIDRWIGLPTLTKSARKRLKQLKPLLLSQRDIEELITLIRLHYRVSIQAGPSSIWQITPQLEAEWRARGIVLPETTISSLVGDAFVAGRLAQILNDGTSLAQMWQMARSFPVPRSAQLALEAVQSRLSYDLSGGVGHRAEQAIGKVLLGEQVKQALVSYRTSKLPDSEAATVHGWRGLAQQLRGAMTGEERARDWERVAVSTVRLSANWGALGAMEEEGVEYVYYDVHSDACDYCKKLYLERDGITPKRFALRDIMSNIAETGGINAGRSASKIGDSKSGWLPNALAHPWCQCRPKRVIEGVELKGRGAK